MFATGNTFSQGVQTLLYQGHTPYNLYYRTLQPSDYEALKAIHRDLFPIDYEEIFFRKAISGEDRVFSWAAVHSEYGRDHLVGFVTARLVYLYECDPVDRQAMGMSPKSLDGHSAVYVLTLGVVASCRQCGIARNLLRLVQQHALRLRCSTIFLHVISYNNAAMRLYGSSGYQPMARLPNFYHLVTGRQPNPDQAWYDAYLYAAFMPSSGPEPSPASQWAGGVLGAAVAPFRSMLGTFNDCMPGWFCRQTYSTFLPLAGSPAPPRTASKSSLADTATSPWQQPLPATPPVSPYQQQQCSHPHSQHARPPPTPPNRFQASAATGGGSGSSFAASSTETYLQGGSYGEGGGLAGRYSDGSVAWNVSVNGNGNGSFLGEGNGSSRSYGNGNGPGLDAGGLSLAMDTPPPPPLPLPGGSAGLPLQGPARSSSNSLQGSHQHQQLFLNHQQLMTGPMLRPPSPLVASGHVPTASSLQQRHPHSSATASGGASGPATPRYPPPGGGGGGGGGGSSGHHNHHGHHTHHSHHHGHGHGQAHGTSSGSSNSGGQGHGHHQSQGQAQHGRHGDGGRGGGGGAQRGPYGLGGSGLQPPPPPPQSGSLLATLLRPPSAPHSKFG